MPAARSADRWGVVVPVKRLTVAKTRLAAYGQDARRALALAFGCDVVSAALSCELVTQVLVVTDDVDAARVLAALGARIEADSPDAGLNPALAHGADLVRAAAGDVGVVTLSADLPALQPADLAGVLAEVPAGGRAFVPDAAGTGTTLLAAAPGARLDPAYGPDSRQRHLLSGAVELPGTPALRRDVDTPQDLRAALSLGVGVRTAAAVAAWGVARPGCTMGR